MGYIKYDKCSWINPENTLRCGCGHEFVPVPQNVNAVSELALEPGTPAEPARPASAFRRALPIVAGLLYVLEAGYLILMSPLQILVGIFESDTKGSFGSDLRLLGIWNLIVSIIFVAIAFSLFRRSKRGYSWGVSTGVLNLFLFYLNQNFSILPIVTAVGFGLVALALWFSRDQFVIGGIKRSPSQPTIEKAPFFARRQVALIALTSGILGACILGACILGVLYTIGYSYLQSTETALMTDADPRATPDPATLPPLNPVTYEEIESRYNDLATPQCEEYLKSLAGLRIQWRGNVIDIHPAQGMVLVDFPGPGTMRVEGVPAHVIGSVHIGEMREFEAIIADVGEMNGLRVATKFIALVQ